MRMGELKFTLNKKVFVAKRTKTLSVRVGCDLEAFGELLIKRYNRKNIQELMVDVFEQFVIQELAENEINDVIEKYREK